MSTLIKSNGLIPSMNTFFDDVLSKDLFDWSDKNFTAFGKTLPSANVKETAKDVTIEIAAPGLKKSDFKIEVKDNVLSISSERKEESEEHDKEGTYARKEFSYESFYRSFRLPSYVDSNKIDASYKDGILHIDVTKKVIDTPKSVKTISIK